MLTEIAWPPTCDAAASIKLALRNEVDILYHCEYADQESLDFMEAARDRIFVAGNIKLVMKDGHIYKNLFNTTH